MEVRYLVYTDALLTMQIVLVFILLLCVQPCKLGILGTVHFNKLLPNNNMGSTSYYTFDTLLKVSINGCIRACQSTEGCENINYERRYVRCNLLRCNENINNEDTSIELETKPGHVFGNKSEWFKVNLMDCAHCEQNKDCEMKIENESSFCRRTVCERPKNSGALENVLVPGSKLVHNCKDGFTKLPRKVQLNKATCLKNGTWDNGFACLKGEEFNASFYHINTQLMTWFEAQDLCQRVFGHLVHIETEDEELYLADLLVDEYKIDTWTGGNDFEIPGTFVWSDGTKLTYTHWFKNQPDSSLEHCIEITLGSGFPGWNDDECTNKQQSVCEMP